MKYTHKLSSSIRTLALSLLIVVALTGSTNVFSASIAHAQDASTTPAAGAPSTVPAATGATTPPAQAPAAGTPSTVPAATGAPSTTPSATTPSTPATAAITTLGGQTVGDVLGNNNDIIVMLSKVLALVLSMISHLLWPLLMFAGGLMKSDFLYTGAIDLKLSEMWIQVRNLVNIAYVLLLLAVALYNVVGLGETVSMLELKKALPKIILGLILVNFSYAGVKVVLDVINVGTTFAFSIGQTDARLTQATVLKVDAAQSPICDTLGTGALAAGLGKEAAEAAKKTLDDKKAFDIAACKKDADCIDKIEKGYAVVNKSKANAADPNAMCVPDSNGKLTLNSNVRKYLKSWNVDSSLMIIAIKFMNIQDLPKVSAEASKGGVTSLTINMLFSVIMFLIYAVSFVVLVIVLFARAAILWMIIIFSPVIVLNATFTIPGVGGNTSKIIKTLIAPMLIGFVLSIGFILLSTMQNINYNGQGNLTSNAPTSSIDTFQDLLVAIGSIVFLWKGIQTATSDTISDKLTSGILEGAQTAGTWLAKAPFKYSPLFQVATPHAGHAGVQEMGKIGVDLIPKMFEEIMQNKDNDRTQAARDLLQIGKSAIPLTEATNPDTLKTLMNERKHTAQHYAVNEKLQKEVIDAVNKIHKDRPEFAGNGPKSNREFRELYEEINRNGKPSEIKIKAFMGIPAAPAAPATQTPAQVSTTMRSEPKMSVVVSNLNNNRPVDPEDVGNAIRTYNTNLESSGVTNVTTQGGHIAKHFKDTNSGAWDNAKKTRIKAAIDASASELERTMSTAEAARIIKAIKDGIDAI